MEKRKIIIGTYDTAAQGWTLASWSFSGPAHLENLVDVPGRMKGPLDLSTTLTDGEPRYGSRTLTAVLECSDGTRLEREALINTMVNWLDGWRMNIVLPDDALHYVVGRVRVTRQYNDLAHAAVQVTATCEPWRYNNDETVVTLTAAEEAQTATLVNSGRMSVVPLLVIADTGDDGAVLIQFGGSSWRLGAGSYALPDIYLTQGSHEMTYSGTGTLTLTYREAVL